VNLASALQTAGRIDDAVSAFRHVVAAWPDAVAGYFGLAAIDPSLLSESDVGRIREIASDGGRPVIDRVHASFALGNVLEKRQDFDGAFSAFSEGNRLRRENASLKPEVPEWMLALPGGPPTFTSVEQAERVHDDFVRETQLNFTPAYVAKFTGGGEPSRAPIFIVGMPRSGSTLLEQILSSHPEVQGLGETLALSRTFREALGLVRREPARAGARSRTTRVRRDTSRQSPNAAIASSRHASRS